MFYIIVRGSALSFSGKGVKDTIHDNFIKRGYSKDDVDCVNSASGLTARQHVRLAVYANRRDPLKNKLGATTYEQIRAKCPNGSSVACPPGCEDDLIRPSLARFIDGCEGTVVRRRPELVEAACQLHLGELNRKELNAIGGVFLRCNPGTQAMQDDMFALVRWFADEDLRAELP